MPAPPRIEGGGGNSVVAAERGRRADRPFQLCIQFLVGSLLLVLGALPITATEVKIFKTEGSTGFAAGKLDGVSLDPLGRLSLAPPVEKLTEIEEPFLFSAVRAGDGWVLGTGNSGKVLRVSSKGEVSTLFEAEESQVFALLAEKDGAVWAGTSPGGKVYRLPAGGGEAQLFFETGETYVWALARAGDGRLLVATGPQGKLFAVSESGEGEVVHDSDEPHLRSLLVEADGGILLGTAGEGRILRLGKNGRIQTLFDALQPEIVALTAGPDGGFFAAALASEASNVTMPTPDAGTAGSSSGGSGDSGDGEDGSSDDAPPGFSGTGSRPSSFSGARSAVFQVSADGTVETIGTLREETVYSLLWQGERLWVATGQEGKLFSHRQGGAADGLVLEKTFDERQVVALTAGEAGPAIATGNAAALYVTGEGTRDQGTFTSSVLDAGTVARFGTFRWLGSAPKGTSIKASFRSGLSSDPDESWSPWTEPRQGAEVPLGDLPKGRFVQWRAVLSSSGSAAPRLDGAELSYRQDNRRPEIQDLSVLDPGQVLVPANFNPTNQVFEPAHPNREGIFTTLETSNRGESRVKPLWKLGYLSLRWQAQDPNQDGLTFALSFRPVGAEGDGEEEGWLPMAEEIEDDHYSFDATVLPDGVYRFRLVAADRDHNSPEEALTAERVTGPVVVDHSPPRVTSVRRDGDEVVVEVRDAWNPLREAVVSTDAGEWRPVAAGDGLVDGRTETLRVKAGKDARLLLLRLTDAAHNVVTVDLLKELP